MAWIGKWFNTSDFKWLNYSKQVTLNPNQKERKAFEEEAADNASAQFAKTCLVLHAYQLFCDSIVLANLLPVSQEVKGQFYFVKFKTTMEALVKSYNEVCMKLYQKLIEDNDQNIAFSPWSIAAAVTMVYVGTKGNTEVQMSENTGTVHIQNIPRAFEELFSNVNQRRNQFILKTANRLYSEKSFHIVQQYQQLIKKHFRAEIQAVDFAQKAEDVRNKINTWVEEQTESKIKDLLPQDSVDSLTKLVLVNALYFKGNWDVKFPEENTEQKPFRLSKTKTKMVPMMFQRNKYNMFYIEELETKVLELPYVNKETSMIILLPDDIKDNTTGLEKLQKELNYVNLKEWTSADGMMLTEVELELPRIRLEENYDLKSYLSKMGMSDLFNPEKADLTGISEKGNLYVSQIFHKVFVDINEEGTEAAAATGAIATVRSGPIVVKVKADHPFLFIIRHNKTKAILFFGAFTSP
ncbi:PREDICTED: leukocyte elastase inhibitor-like [Nanorana parkeri]|uniref:leukocyte elastase inhibitor-like n=1 Tax=Nanorana parkeri TaxID=125878 RepID=UPI000854D81F|nr:PREDICTED: leukocyte elastase inhibitor-like [Nanorana parkeri]